MSGAEEAEFGKPALPSGGNPAKFIRMANVESESRQIESLYRISSLVGEIDDPQEALRVILDEMVRVFGASSASVAMVHPDSRELRIEAASGLPPDTTDFPSSWGSG